MSPSNVKRNPPARSHARSLLNTLRSLLFRQQGQRTVACGPWPALRLQMRLVVPHAARPGCRDGLCADADGGHRGGAQGRESERAGRAERAVGGVGVVPGAASTCADPFDSDEGEACACW